MTRWGVTVLLALAALAGAGRGTEAADARGEFVLRGIGAQSCESGLAMVKADQRNAADLASWITGYVTALNRVTPGTYDLLPITDVTALVQIVGGMCSASPRSSMEEVVARMVQSLSAARIGGASPMVEASEDGRKVLVRAATLSAMQRKLTEARLYKGPVDGQFGDKTSDALKKYQKRRKLDQTGLPDTRTVLHMLVEPDDQPSEEAEEKPKKKKR
ncbi:MAG: peptidoglycan-binding domain-containing protein [Sphingomonadales bacterium]